MTNVVDPDSIEIIRILELGSQIEADRKAALEHARAIGQREVQAALASEVREADSLKALTDRAARLDGDVNRCLVRAGAPRPQPSPGGVLSEAQVQAALDAITKDLRSLTGRFDWLERNQPRQDQTHTRAATEGGQAIAPVTPSNSSSGGRHRWLLISVALAALLVMVLVLASVL